MPVELKSVCPKKRKQWREWLQKHHTKQTGVCLIFYKKNSGKSTISYNDAVEEVLCFGWIDSIVMPIDHDKYMQKFTPRKVKSVWSAINKKRVEKLLEQNLIQNAGLAIIETGKKNGSRTKLDHVENFTIPFDLEKVFAKNKKVRKYFESLAMFKRKIWLYRLNNAKLNDTRIKRLSELIGEAKSAKPVK